MPSSSIYKITKWAPECLAACISTAGQGHAFQPTQCTSLSELGTDVISMISTISLALWFVSDLAFVDQHCGLTTCQCAQRLNFLGLVCPYDPLL